MLALLFHELKAAPYFLVLDNFEIILDPQTNTPLKLKQGFSDLIENAKENAGRSRFLFTSWECPASERGIRPEFYCIGGLDESAAIQLLRRNGLTEPDDELKKAVALSGGHPLALILLVQLVKEGAETLSGVLKDNSLWIGEKGEVAEKILDKVYKERLSEEEHKLLQYVSLYREPVPLKAIAAAADPASTEVVVKKIALGLIRKSLLQKAGENYWEESLIHSYADNKLTDKVERIERHKHACQYYLSLPLPEKEKRTKKEDVQSLIEAHYHACMAGEYDQAASIIFDYELHEDLFRWGSYRTLVELYTGVLPKDPLRDKSLLSDIKTHSSVLGNLGLAYSDLGEVRKAIDYYEKALKIDQEIGDRQGKGARLGNLGNAYSDLGEVRKAIEYYENAMKIDQEIGDRQDEGAWLENLGSAYYALGEVKKAIEYHEKALKIAQEIGDRKGEGSHIGNLGLAYRDIGEVKKAIDYYEKALKIDQEIGDKKGEGIWLGNLGLTYRDLGKVRKAIEYYEKALKIAVEIGDRKGEGVWLGNFGFAYYSLGVMSKAIECYENALKIAQGIGDRKGEGIRLGNLGLVYYSLGEMSKAIECYENALKIAQEIGDRKSEENNIGNLGLAYSAIGDVRKTIEYYKNALKIAQEIGDRRGEGLGVDNLGIVLEYEKKYKEALACYLLAKDIRTRIENPDLEITESNLKNLKEKLGADEFEKLAAEVVPRAEDIVRKMLERA